jgi:hypothetical protein
LNCKDYRCVKVQGKNTAKAAEIQTTKLKILEGLKEALGKNNVGLPWSLAIWCSGNVEQWNEIPFISKVKIWVLEGGHSHPMFSFIVREMFSFLGGNGIDSLITEILMYKSLTV